MKLRASPNIVKLVTFVEVSTNMRQMAILFQLLDTDLAQLMLFLASEERQLPLIMFVILQSDPALFQQTPLFTSHNHATLDRYLT